jgi:hypothetical protein
MPKRHIMAGCIIRHGTLGFQPKVFMEIESARNRRALLIPTTMFLNITVDSEEGCGISQPPLPAFMIPNALSPIEDELKLKASKRRAAKSLHNGRGPGEEPSHHTDNRKWAVVQ